MREIKELLRKLEPVLKEKTKGLWYINLLSRDSKSRKQNRDILRLLVDRKVKQNYQETIRLPPPEKEKLTGEYLVGDVIYPNVEFSEFGLKEDEFIKHIFFHTDIIA